MSINFKIGFQADTKDLGPALAKIGKDIENAFQIKGPMSQNIAAATKEAMALEGALKRATAVDGTVSYTRMAMELNKAGTSAATLTTTLAKGGANFKDSLAAANQALALSNRSAFTLGKTMKEVWRVTTQSFKFTAAQTFLRAVSTEAQEAIKWVTNLNEAVNEIATVTGKTGEEVQKITEQAVRGSKALKVAAEDYAKGALIFYQQGLDDKEVIRRNETTIKASLAANQSIADMSKQLTAIWNTYGMAGDEQQRAASVGAALAAQTAVDFKDIAEAMQATAAPAAQMGVEFNQLAAIIATVGDVSQQSASTIGNAYKTIFSRFQQLKAEGTDGEVTLSSVSKQLQSLGVNVLDSAGNLRELGVVINEVGANWDNWTQTQQTAIAQIVGGTRQYGQFLTLMQNFDKYQKNLSIANNETGSTLEAQYEQALDSITHKMEAAAEAWKRAFGEAIPEESLKAFYDMSTEVANVFGTMVKSLGGLPGILTMVGVALSSKIVPSLITGAQNAKIMMNNLTPQGREKNIKNDYNSQIGAIDRQMEKATTNTEVANLQTQRAKLMMYKEMALANEEINNKLKTATGMEKIQLQQQQSRLQTAAQIIEDSMNETQELQKQLNLMTEINSVRGIRALTEEATGLELSKQDKQDALAEVHQKITDLDSVVNVSPATMAKLEGLQTAAAELEKEIALIDTQLNKINAKLGTDGPKNLDAMAAGFKKSLAEMVKIERSGENGEKKLERQKQVLSELINKIKELSSQGSKTDVAFDEWKQSLQEVTSDGVAPLLQEIKKVLSEAEIIDDSLDAVAQDVIETMGQLEHAGDIISPERIAEIVVPKVDTTQVISGFTQLGMSVAGTITSVKSLYDLLSNPDTTGLEKMIGLMTQLPMFLMQYSQAMAGITVITQQWAAAQGAASIATLTSTYNITEDTAAKVLNAVATAKAKGENVEAAVAAELAAAGYLGEASAATIAGTASKLAAGEIGKATIAAQMFGFSSALAFGKFLIIAAAVAAAVALIVFAWKEYENQKPENKLKRAEEAAKSLAEEEKKAAQAAQDLKDVFNNYKSVEDTLKNCTRGTEEWEEALRNVNQAALDVVDALPSTMNVADAYSRDADGRIRINEDAVKAVQTDLDNKAFGASYASSVGGAQVSMAKNDVLAANLGSIISNSQKYWVGESEMTDQTAAEVTRLLTESAESFKNLAEGDVDGFRKALDEAGIHITNLSDSEINNVAARLNELAVNTEAANEKMSLIAKIAVDEKLKGKNVDNNVKDATGERIARRTTDLTNDYLGALTNGKEGNASNAWQYGQIMQSDTKINNKLLEEYNELTGKNWVSSGNGVQGTDRNRVFEFIDEEGNTIKRSAKQMAEEMAAAAALLEVESAAADIAADFAKLDSIINDKAQQGSYNSLNNGAMKAEAVKSVLMGQNMDVLNDNELQAMADMTHEQVVEMLKGMFDLEEADAAKLNEFAEGWGYESFDALAESIENGAQASITASEHAADALTGTTKKMYDEITKDKDLTVSAKENLASSLKQIFNDFDTQTAQEFSDIMQKMGGDADSFLSNINEIDWNTASPDNLREKLKELGVDASKVSDEDLQKLIKTLQGVGDSSVKAAQAFNKNLKDAASGVDGNNSIISDEDFQKLQQAGVNVGAFFSDMGDGTHQLMADADLFKQTIHDIEMGKLQEAKEAALNQTTDLSNAKNWIDHVDNWQEGSDTQTGAMAWALKDSGMVDNSTFDSWRDQGWVQNAEVAEQVRQAYADAGMSAEKIDDMIRDAANEAERAQVAMDNADFAFEVESAGLDLEETTRYAERLKKEMLAGKDVSKMSKDEMRLYTKAAQDAAIANQKLDRGVGSLKDNMKDYKKALKEANKGTAEYSEAMDSLKKDLADVVGFDDADLLSDDFALATMESEDLQKAINGDTEAIRRLQAAAGEDMILNIQVSNDLTDEEFDNVLSQWNYLKTEMEKSITAGDVDQTDLINSFNDMIKNGHMTKDQIEAALSALHVSANVKTTYTTSQEQVPIQAEEQWWEPNPSADQTVPIYDDDGNQVNSYKKPAFIKKTKSWTSGYDYADVVVPSYEIEGTTDEGGNTTAFIDAPAPKLSKGGSKFSDATGSSKGGGGSTKTPEHKSKKAEKRTKLDDRYSTIKSKIDDVARALEDYSNAEDDAFGAAKLAAMQKQEQSLVQQAKHYKTLRQMALNYLKVDQQEASSGKNRTDLKAKLAELGLDNNLIDVQYDDDGYIANRTEIIQQLDALLESKYNVYKAAADAYDKDKSTNEAESERIDALKEEYEGLDKLVQLFIGDLDQVDETAAEARQALLDELEKIREWMQKKVDQANYKLELRIGINEMDIKMMELTIKLWDKLGVKMGSTFNNLHKNLTSSADSLQGMIENSNRMWEILNNISPDSEHQDWFKKEFGEEVWQEYLNGNGALPASVIENLEEKADSMLSELSGMYDTAEEMLGQFVEAMNMFLEDFDKIADKLARQNEKLDMFEELLDFSGKKYSVEGREAMMGILKARMDNAKVAVANAKAEQEFTKVAVEEAKASLEQFYAQEGRDVNSYDDTAAFFYNQLKNTLDEAEAAAAEAESNFYQSMQELTAAARAAIEESARIIEEELVDSLGGIFDSFDSGLDMYQHQDDMYNFFLDDYDKGYELKKLLGEIEDAMEDVTDPERLAEWGTLVDDINAANQDGVKITQTDLDILKARFDLQKAYDEYTDARAGKNTMRLQRDASGNYSYVYSSDNNSEADDNQQKIEDALHNIHKMHREAADEMQSMWFQTYVEMEKYISEVDQLRLQNDAKYAAEVEWYKNMYQQKLEHYRDQTIQHNAAIDRSYEETTLGVITGMEDMEGTHEWYMEQAHKYDEKLKESALSWEAQVRDTCNENGINYDNLEKVVKEDTDKMIDENKALKDEINRLKTEGTASLRSLGSQIRSFVSQGVSKLREMKRAVEELIQKLQELKRLQLAQENAKSSYYDETTDYSALGANLFREAVKRGEFSEDEYEKFLRQNSFIVDQVYAAQMQDTTRGQYYKGNDSSYSWEDALKHIIAAQGTDRTDWNFRDTSKIEVNGNIVITGDGTWDISTGQKIPETASGGLIVKEQVRSLAEEGPELVLNAEDTKNILEAVRLVRQNVEAQLGARMMTQMSELQKLAENVDYHRYGLDDQYKAYVDAAIAGQEQRVQIEANFPGVTVASEIEEAFNQLVTQAAQYRIRQDR